MPGYNGWENYETWLAVTWFASDEDDHEFWEQQARDVYEAAEAGKYQSRIEAAVHALSDMMKDHIVNEIPINKSSMYRDLLLSSIDQIEFDEVAQAYIDGIRYDVEDQEDDLEDE